MGESTPFAERKIVYQLPGMEDVAVEKDRPYKTIDGIELSFDLYRPRQSDPSNDLPAVVFVHGEGPPEVIKNSKDWGQYDGWGRLTALSGMMAVIFNRRSSHFFSRLSEPASDVDDLLDLVFDSSDHLGIDPQRVGIWVCSGGTPFGMRAGLQRPVKCIACYYGRLSLSPIREEIEGGLSDVAFEEYSAAARLGTMRIEQIPPMFIVKAELDDLRGVNESIEEALNVARVRNLPVTVASHAQGVHGMDVRNDDDRTREIIDLTLAFFRRHLGVVANQGL